MITKEKKQMRSLFLVIPLAVSLFVISFIPTPVEGNYTLLSVMTSVRSQVIRENTEIVEVVVGDNENSFIAFTDNGQTTLELDENTAITQFDVFVILNKYYADTSARAASRTRVRVTLTNPSDAVIYDNYIGAPFVWDNGSYWTVVRVAGTNTPLYAGNWVLQTEYEILAIIENA